MQLIHVLRRPFVTNCRFSHVFEYFCHASFGSLRALQIYFVITTISLPCGPYGGLWIISGELCPMVASKMTSFCKNEDCPTSQELLEFQKRDLPRTRTAMIGQHLALCEFCSAEVELYSCYPQDEGVSDSIESVVIPAPLYQLAEALLKNRHADPSSLDSLLKKRKRLAVDKA